MGLTLPPYQHPILKATLWPERRRSYATILSEVIARLSRLPNV